MLDRIALLTGALALSIGPSVAVPVSQAQLIHLGITPVAVAIDEKIGRVFVAGSSGGAGRLAILDMAGRILHVANINGSVQVGVEGVPSTDVVTDDALGHIFVTSFSIQAGTFTGSWVSMLDARSGAVLRVLHQDTAPLHIVCDQARSRVYVVDEAPLSKGAVSNLTVLDAGTGMVISTVFVNRRPRAIAVDDKGRVFVIAQPSGASGTALGPGLLGVVEPQHGHVVRVTKIAQDPQQVVVDNKRGRVFVVASALSPPYIGTVDIVNTTTGRVMGTLHTGPTPIASVVDQTTGRVYVLNKGYEKSSSISVFDPSTGGTVHTINLPGAGVAMALDSHHTRIFIAVSPDPSHRGGRSVVSVLNTSTVALVRDVPVDDNPNIVAVDEQSGRVIVTTLGKVNPTRADRPISAGTATLLDATNGRIRCIIPVGTGPVAVGVDAKAGRAFVLNSFSNSMTAIDPSAC